MGKKDLTKDKRTILILVAQMTRLRDDLESLKFSGRLKNRTNMWLTEANKALDNIMKDLEIDSRELVIEVTRDIDKKLKEI